MGDDGEEVPRAGPDAGDPLAGAPSDPTADPGGDRYGQEAAQAGGDYRTPIQQPLHHLAASEARRHLAAGQFPEGSMGPKIQAALHFLEAGGPEVVITDRAHLVKALEGGAGTHIESGPPALLPGGRLLH